MLSFFKHHVHLPVLGLMILGLGLIVLVAALALNADRTDALSGSAVDYEARHVVDLYRVIVKPPELYSVVPADEPIPAGWKDTGFSGTELDCRSYIEQITVSKHSLSTDYLGRLANEHPSKPAHQLDSHR